MLKVAEPLIQSALKTDPLLVAIIFLGLVACGLIWLLGLAITRSERR